jgi:hypothetical protein
LRLVDGGWGFLNHPKKDGMCICEEVDEETVAKEAAAKAAAEEEEAAVQGSTALIRRSSFVKSKKERRPSADGSDFKLEGWLKKQAHGVSAVLKGWQERYFAITGHYLNYYEGREKAEVKGSVDLMNITNVTINHVVLELEEADIMLVHKLKADSEEEALLWMSALEKAIETASNLKDKDEQKHCPSEGHSSPRTSPTQKIAGKLQKLGNRAHAMEDKINRKVGLF